MTGDRRRRGPSTPVPPVFEVQHDPAGDRGMAVRAMLRLLGHLVRQQEQVEPPVPARPKQRGKVKK
jgi:hypothetical protein